MDYNLELLNIPVSDLLSTGSTKVNNNFTAMEQAINDLRTIVDGLAGENLSSHQLVYGNSGSYYIATNDDTEAKADVVGITLESITSGNSGVIQFGNGLITDETWTWTPGAELFLGEDGAITEDYGDAEYVKPVGYAVSATVMLFNLQLGYNQDLEQVELLPDQLELSFVPAASTPTVTPECTAVTQLAAHLKGIDDALTALEGRIAALE